MTGRGQEKDLLLPGWRHDERNHFPLVSAVDAKIPAVGRDDQVLRVKLTETYEADICKVWVLIGKSPCNLKQARHVVEDIQHRCDKPLLDEFQSESSILKMKCRFCQNRIASKQRFGNLVCQVYCPIVVEVVPVGKSYEETRVCDSVHDFEKPFREERSRGPDTTPAKRMKPFSSADRAFSSCSRTIFP